MNRFRTRRKAKEQQQASSHSDFDPLSGLSFGSKSFGKNKKPMPESKSAIDLTMALPSSNDFRTSLIMPNLSARFSMLREQDDPSTKIGKANDDSVLFPKRASRLNLFSHNPLTDIAEVDSIRESIKPPFACRGRTHSFDSDGYDSDCGASIMNRSRPGEGNNLFGGRQKLYKIPVELSTKSPLRLDTSQPDPGAMSGRVMYEDDVSLSLFQKYREKEREGPRKKQETEGLDGAEADSQHSPVDSFSKDRGTTSSTTSMPRRNSTAATSVESHSPCPTPNNGSASSLASPLTAAQPKPGLDRNATMYRKLYGQALYQSNPLSRVPRDVFDNLGRPRAASNDRKPKVGSAVKGNSSLNDNPSRPDLSPTLSNFRSASPPPFALPSGTPTLDSTLRDTKPSEPAQGHVYGYARPLSPPISDGEDATTFVNSVQPEDRGKATAMGLFNKPSRNYDEHQFSQRQLQMHQGRSSPVPHKGSPTPASTPASPEERAPALETPDTSEGKPNIAHDARVHAGALIRRQNEELAALEAQRMASTKSPRPVPPSSQDAPTRDTFLLDEDDSPSKKSDTAQSIRPGDFSHETHPAFRPVVEGFKFPPFDSTPTRAQLADEHRPVSSVSEDRGRNSLDGDDFDPVTEGLGLSGLIRTHLRHDSDKSSIYPPLSPRFPSGRVSESPRSRASPVNTNGFEGPSQAQATDVQLRMAQNAKQFLDKANALRNRSNSRAQGLVDEGAGRSSQDADTTGTWQDEWQTKHQRGGSTETQQEREAFNNELAERRRKVQEKLKTVAGGSNRSASPLPPAEQNLAKPGNGFSAMLRAKPNRSKLNGNQPNPTIPPDHSAKAMKLLGLGAASPPKHGSANRPQEELWKEEEERMLEDFALRPKPKHKFGPPPTNSLPQPPPEPPSSTISQSQNRERSRQRSAPASTRSSGRDRSDSDVSGRSKSRNGQYRDDLDKAMAEGTGFHARSHGPPNPSNISMASRPSIEVGDQPERSTSAMSGRYRSNSRANTPGYFESKPLKPLQTHGISSSLASRSSPRTPYSANSTPPIFETSPAIPNSSAFALPQASTDGRTTPSVRGRKRSVTKNMISDPTFISTTYSVSTIDLPPGASLRNGSPDIHHQKDPSSTPAIPFMNPSRRRGRAGTGSGTTHTLLSTLAGRTSNDSKTDLAAGPQSARPSLPEVESTFPFDEGGEAKKPSPLRPRQRLRKVSSEGGDMSAKARYQALMAGPSPALPTFPVKRGPSPTMRGPPPTMRGPSPTMMRGPSPTTRRMPVEMEGGMF